MPGVRCGRAQIAAAAGLCTDRGKVETLRAKLKRLAERGWLAEEAGRAVRAARAERQRCGGNGKTGVMAGSSS